MSPLADRIRADSVAAMKSGDRSRLGTLRLILSAVQSEEISRRGSDRSAELSDADLIAVLKREVKKRRDSIALYRSNGREDLAAQEESEIACIRAYLPSEISREAIEEIARRLAAPGMEFGALMRAVIEATGGAADGALVAEVVKQTLLNNR